MIPIRPWVHPSLEVRPSGIAGHGLFATTPLAAGTVVMRLGGRVVPDGELAALISASDEYIDTVTLGDGQNLVLPAGTTAHYGNHSCEPNLVHRDRTTIATGRDVAAAEELTVDYETQTGELGTPMACSCGAATCRGSIIA